MVRHFQNQGHTMTPAQVRSLVSRYISERLDEWEEFFVSSGLDDEVNGQWQDCLSACVLTTRDESTEARGSHRLGDERAVHQFMERYKLSVKPGSSAYRMLCRELVKAEKVIQANIREIA
jgi:hypothetical protein